ncbi:hypothetical protein FJTKL_09872 [Diaporthe vaccinii]|uniref:Uncharacterized protein n=1 Tax=Diaporthe vaccinii TaxID=105482 RepID=A0ABR4EMB1_9PEZI
MGGVLEGARVRELLLLNTQQTTIVCFITLKVFATQNAWISSTTKKYPSCHIYIHESKPHIRLDDPRSRFGMMTDR